MNNGQEQQIFNFNESPEHQMNHSICNTNSNNLGHNSSSNNSNNNNNISGNNVDDVTHRLDQMNVSVDVHMDADCRVLCTPVDSDDEDYNSDSEQPYGDHQNNTSFLSIPRQSKQFLISPPVSPPTGWKPQEEGSPCIDIQLISAIANLVPGQVHEIHAGNESQPGIFVEVCEDSKQYDGPSGKRSRIPKTANPIAAARAAMSRRAMRT